MLKLTIPKSEILFEAILEPKSSEVKKVKKGKEEGIINTFLGKVNKVIVGVPYYENLISRFIEKDEEIPHEIKKMMSVYDFHFAALSCSFLPDPDFSCRFVWAEFGVELISRSKSGTVLKEKPIAFDIFPEEILSPIKYRSEVQFGTNLKSTLGLINMSINEQDVESRDFILYEPQIFSYGINSSKPMWIFKSTQSKGLWGNKRGLILQIRTPKDTMLKGKFHISAKIGSYIGKRPIPFSTRKEDNLISNEFDLSYDDEIK